MNFKRDDGRDIEINVKWAPREPDVGIMQEYIDDYELEPGEPPLTESEEKRFFETAECPQPDDDWEYP